MPLSPSESGWSEAQIKKRVAIWAVLNIFKENRFIFEISQYFDEYIFIYFQKINTLLTL